MRLIVDKNDSEVINLINEFVGMNKLNSKQELPLRLLFFFRERNVKIESGTIFEEICNMIEKRMLK